MTERIFCVQDRTGTSIQVALDGAPGAGVQVGDTGTYAGDAFTMSDDTTTETSIPFTVNALNDDNDFCIFTKVTTQLWPSEGTITWSTGANTDDESTVVAIYPANAYITQNYLLTYLMTRGMVFTGSNTDAQMQGAIVQATDYIDQKYKFKGAKLSQYLTNPQIFGEFLSFAIDPFIMWDLGFGYGGGVMRRMSSITQQRTEWPRAGAVDANGDIVYDIAPAVQRACAEVAWRALNGTVLQPDYDPTIARQGAVIQSLTENVGPLQTTTVYDTKFGLGFFPDFPQVKRILQSSGLLVASGGRSVIR